MAPSFRTYIDESGDEGFGFGDGCSDWFVLSAAITRETNDVQAVSAVDDIKAAVQQNPKKVLHYRRLKAAQKLAAVQRVAAAPVRTVSVMVHKPSLTDPETFQLPNKLYFYAARYLVERVSWFCRDNRKPECPGDGSSRFIFGRREGMPYVDMQNYIELLRAKSTYEPNNVVWSVVRPESVESARMSRYKGLQLADIVAGAFFNAVDESRTVPRDCQYARCLKPVVYNHRGRHIGYGMKLFPKECISGNPLLVGW